MLTGSGSGTVQHPYEGPTGQGGLRMQCILMLELISVVVLYCIFNWSLSLISLIDDGSEFQSIIVRGINEYLKQFLLVEIGIGIYWSIAKVSPGRAFSRAHWYG